MKITDNFDLREFVDPVTWAIRGEKSIELIDARLITLVQFMRDYFDVPVTINNWHTGGKYRESGLRTFNTETGATYSQHKYGRAADLKFSGLTPEYVRKEIRRNWPVFMDKGLTCIEKDAPTWVHVDCRNTTSKTLLEVPYK